VHAVLTGTSMVLMEWLHVRLGFGFSAGLFDYVLNFRLAERPLWLLPVGAAYFAVYFTLFRWAILRFDLRTPGREAADTAVAATTGDATARDDAPLGARFVQALGGAANLRAVDACTTRLRLEVADQGRVDEPALRRLGAHGLVRPSAHALQIVLGPVADQVAGQIRRHLGPPGREAPATPPAAAACTLAPEVLAAFGGHQNVVAATQVAPTRVRVQVRDDARVDAVAVSALSPRGCVRVAAGRWHVLVPAQSAG
jgi:PTS system N-acetylglucosamine-specific IIC component